LHFVQLAFFFSQLHNEPPGRQMPFNESEHFRDIDGPGTLLLLSPPPVDTNGLHALRGGRIRLQLNFPNESDCFMPLQQLRLFSILSTANPSRCG
jgi:hypothetical protein